MFLSYLRLYSSFMQVSFPDGSLAFLGFEEDSYTVNESSGPVEVCVVVLGVTAQRTIEVTSSSLMYFLVLNFFLLIDCHIKSQFYTSAQGDIQVSLELPDGVAYSETAGTIQACVELSRPPSIPQRIDLLISGGSAVMLSLPGYNTFSCVHTRTADCSISSSDIIKMPHWSLALSQSPSGPQEIDLI